MTTVHVEWDGYNWIGIVEGGGATQARRLEQIPAYVVEVVKLMTGETIDVDDVEMDIHVPGDAEDIAAEMHELRTEVERIQQRLADKTLRTTRALRDQGFPLRDIGVITGLSYQRVHQLLRSHRRRERTARTSG